MDPLLMFLVAIIAVALASGPLYMRMLARGEKPDPWWRGRRDGALVVGAALLIGGVIFYAIGGVGAITFAWLLLISAAFNLSIAATCHLVLRRLPARGEGGEGAERGA